MRRANYAILLVAFLGVTATSAPAQQGRYKADPDWPCRQVKTPVFSLASVWSGPQIDMESRNWRDDPNVVDLVAVMATRRIPVEEAIAKISAFTKNGGEAARAKLLQAFGAAFSELTHQRSEIIDGLDRFGRKQHELVTRIREESQSSQDLVNATTPGQAVDPSQPGADGYVRLQWDMRVFEDRGRAIGYVCETPTLIEQRIGALARAIEALQ